MKEEKMEISCPNCYAKNEKENAIKHHDFIAYTCLQCGCQVFDMVIEHD